MNQLIKVNRMRRRDIQRGHHHLECASLDALEYLVCGVRVGKAVEFCGRGGVAGDIDGAAHPDDLADAGKGVGVGAEREGEVAYCARR